MHVDEAVALLRLAGDGVQPGTPMIVDGGTGRGVAVRKILALLAQAFDPAPAVGLLGTARNGDPTDMIADLSGAAALGWPRVSPEAGLRGYLRRYAADRASAP